jgi:hypothetical protein
MKQIIRSNAVKKLTLRGNLGIKGSNLDLLEVQIEESVVLSATVNLSVLPQGREIVIKNKSNRSTSWENKTLSAFAYVVWENGLGVKIAKTKTLLHSIWMQRRERSSFRNSFFACNYGNC